MHTVLRAAVMVALTLSAVRASGEEHGGWEVSGGLPLAIISGHSTYRIFASDGASSVASELEFPLQGYLAGARVQAARRPEGSRWRWVVSGTAMHTLTEERGTLEDSDWIDGPVELAPPPDGVGQAHPGKDIYSTSKAFTRVLVVEARVAAEQDVSPSVRLAPMAGVLYQRFDYQAGEVRQTGYGPYDADFSGTYPGRAIEYEVRYRAIYLGARGELGTGALTGAAEVWYSPFAHAEDRDDHLLRSKLSTTTASGTAWQAGVEGRLAVGPADTLSANVSVVRFDTSGTQVQRFYAGPYAGLAGTIDATIRSSRTTFLAAWTHRL